MFKPKCLIITIALVSALLSGCASAQSTATPESADAAAPTAPAGDLDGARVRPADGMDMVFADGGVFQMGSARNDPLAQQNETPAHSVTVDSFWIDRTEVTNAHYMQCVDDGSCRESAYAWDRNFNSPDLPAVGVAWQEAADYCAWAGARLPTEAEWEYAARGRDNHLYPWGDVFDGTRLNYCDVNCDEGDWADATVDDGHVRSAPAGSYPDGASWCGALDMAGNVWEWVADWYGGYDAEAQTNPIGPEDGRNRIIRGGCWANALDGVRGAYRLEMGASVRHPNIGFRCVVSADVFTD